MARAQFKPDWQRALIALSAVTVTTAIVAVLYWARSIFVPIALAIFFASVLAPLVTLLQKRGLGRTPAVILVVAGAVVTFAMVVYVIATQVGGLADTLPDHEARIKQKIEAVKGRISGGQNSRLGKFFDELEKMVTPPPAAAVAPAEGTGPPGVLGSEKAVPATVVVKPESSGLAARLDAVAGPALEVVAQAAFAFILVVFMLIKREDLRNRFLRLVGQERVTTTTKAVDDASRRVSRYLLTQLLLNSAFGTIISAGLFLLGVPYALLWGFIATLMRYVPYIGTWIGVIPPFVYTFAVSDGFWQPAGVLVLFLGLEAVCNNIFEPWLYGTSLGVSEVAQLVAAGFWSFLWGPIGLILSGPLTTCLLVLGKYAPQLRFLEVLLGDEPPLEPGVMYFQRLTARDQDEAARILSKQAKDAEPAAVFDGVVVPALTLARTAAHEGDIDSDDEQFIYDATHELIEDVPFPPAAAAGTEVGPRVRILCCPARDEAEQLTLEMLARLLGPDRWEARVATAATLTAEFVERVAEFGPAIVCIAALPPGGLAHTRYLCKRLRSRFPDLKIVVGRFGGGADIEADKEELADVGVDQIYPTLTTARQQLQAWLTVLQVKQEEEVPPPDRTEAALVGTASA